MLLRHRQAVLSLSRAIHRAFQKPSFTFTGRGSCYHRSPLLVMPSSVFYCVRRNESLDAKHPPRALQCTLVKIHSTRVSSPSYSRARLLTLSMHNAEVSVRRVHTLASLIHIHHYDMWRLLVKILKKEIIEMLEA